MYTRSLNVPGCSFFLFGPRGVGKSTWIKQTFQDARIFDLLPAEESLKFAKNPSLLSAAVTTEPKDRWIVIDEIQKTPALLDEVHHLMENEGYQRFVLSGSSARKLKRGAANMLAGRAITKAMYPFTSKELDFIWWYGETAVGIEVKTSTTIRKQHLKGLKTLAASMVIEASYLVYLGSEELLIDGIQIMPVMQFLRKLHQGAIIGQMPR